MKEIEKKYKKNGYYFEQVSREDDVAVYAQILPETGRTVAYEVFEVQKHREREMGGVLIGASEGCPSNEQWGKFGFTLPTILTAQAKATVLLKNAENRKNAHKQPLSGQN